MNLIYQYYRDPNQEQNQRSRRGVFVQTGTNYHVLSKNSLSAYANNIGVEYQFLDQDLPGNIPPFYGIFLPFIENHEWYKQFEYICFVDSDFLVTTHAKNVFDYANPNCISAWWMPTMARWRGKAGYEWFAEHGHINSGVVIWPRSMFAELVEFASTIEQRDKQRNSMENSMGGFDQGIINSLIFKQKKYHCIPEEFNYHLGRKPPENRFENSFIHYHRQHKKMMHDDIKDERILK